MSTRSSVQAPEHLPGHAGYAVDVASVMGGRVPLDPESLRGAHARTPAVRRFMDDGAGRLLGSPVPCLAGGLSDIWTIALCFSSDGRARARSGGARAAAEHAVHCADRCGELRCNLLSRCGELRCNLLSRWAERSGAILLSLSGPSAADVVALWPFDAVL